MGSSGLLTIVLMLGVFYFFLIRPEQAKQKKFREMINSLKTGDVVLTRGGIHGVIVELKEDIVTVATGPDAVKIDLSRQGIGSILESAVTQEENKADENINTDEAK